ncbi:MAG: hypothetical protein L0312_17575 [Acidobacteria bacterium]|nr:hypothetical protein [Acidobacteriota bacterium]
MSSFGWIDWGIIGVYLIGTIAAGLAMRRDVGKVEHFHRRWTGNGRLPGRSVFGRH